MSLEEVVFENDSTFLTEKETESYWIASVMDASTLNGGPRVSLSRNGLNAKDAFDRLANALLEQKIEVI